MHSIKNLISILWQEYKFVRFMRKSKPPQKEFRNEWNEKKGVPVGFDQGAWECWYRKRNRCPCCPWQKRKQKMSGANSAPANQCNRNTGWTLIEIQGCRSPAFFFFTLYPTTTTSIAFSAFLFSNSKQTRFDGCLRFFSSKP